MESTVASTYFGASTTLRTPENQSLILKFVRDQFPQATFQRIYDATTDGWKSDDFHRCCDGKGWTLTIAETTEDFIFGGFTTAEWESQPSWPPIPKRCPHSFLFSVNEGSKYPVTSEDKRAIDCLSDWCAAFGWNDLVIKSDSNDNTKSWCNANHESFQLPAAKGSEYPSINGGEKNFQLKQFEVYSVTVRITFNIIFRNNERKEGGSQQTDLFSLIFNLCII